MVLLEILPGKSSSSARNANYRYTKVVSSDLLLVLRIEASFASQQSTKKIHLFTEQGIL